MAPVRTDLCVRLPDDLSVFLFLLRRNRKRRGGRDESSADFGLPEHLKSFTEGKYRAEIQENQEGNLHYGTYRVLNTETQAEIFRMEVSENGSVQYSWNGQYVSYDAPKNVYSHRTESQ